jgi:hypothetical protein
VATFNHFALRKTIELVFNFAFGAKCSPKKQELKNCRGAFTRVDVIVSRVGERKKTLSAQWKKAGELFRSEMYENSGYEFVAWLFVC